LVAPDVETGAAVAAGAAGNVSFVYVRINSGEPRYQAIDKATTDATATAPARWGCPARKLLTVVTSTPRFDLSVPPHGPSMKAEGRP